MIRTKNLTHFSFGYRAASRRPPQAEMTMIVRGRYVLRPGEPLSLCRAALKVPELDPEDRDARADELVERAEYILGQGPLSPETYADDDPERKGPLVYPGDFAEFKPNAEVMVRATCHPPGGRMAETCAVEVAVGAWSKRLLVTGPRVWVDKILGGKATDPVAFATMPLDWRHAFGGDGVEENPVGKGPGTEELPTVTYPEDVITRAGQRLTPASFAPVSPAWLPRKQRVGKNYGEEYERTRAPWYSDDFDWRYCSAAPDDQQQKGYLRGDETLRFKALHPASADFETKLPGVRPRAFVMKTGGAIAEVSLVLDTVYADLESEELLLTWRGLTPVAHDDLADVELILLAEELLGEPKRSEREYHVILEAFARDPVGFEEGPIAALQQLEKDLDSGALDAAVDATPPDKDAASELAAGLVAKLAPGHPAAGGVDVLREGAARATRGSPDAQAKIRAALKDALDVARSRGGVSGPLRPGPGMNQGLTPMIRRMVRHISEAQKTLGKSGASFAVAAEALQDKLDGLDLPNRDQLTPEAVAKPPGEPGPGCDLSGEDLSGRDFSGMDLSDANLEGAILARAKLVGTVLRGANLAMTSLASADLTRADLTGADLTSAQLSRTVLRGAMLDQAKLDHAIHLHADFTGAGLRGISGFSTMSQESLYSGADLTGAELEFSAFLQADFEGANLSQSNLERTMFHECKLAKARFDQARLARGGFVGCDLTGATFLAAKADTTNWLNSRLGGANFSYAALPDSIFSSVDARDARFSAVDAPAVRFYKANLRNVSFEGANLRGADLRKASLTDARFTGANAYQACFMEAHGNGVDLREANVKGASFRRSKMTQKT